MFSAMVNEILPVSIGQATEARNGRLKRRICLGAQRWRFQDGSVIAEADLGEEFFAQLKAKRAAERWRRRDHER